MNKRGVRIFFSLLLVLVISMVAIVIHIVVPTPAGDSELNFDSIFVKLFSFPVVASIYFIVLSLHIYLLILLAKKYSPFNWKTNGLLIGLSFCLIYLVAMQEVVVSASPFEKYGFDFILYQLIIGLGDGLPSFALAMILSYINRGDQTASPSFNKKELFDVIIICISFVFIRLITNLTKLTGSNIYEYPIPVVIWDILFGFTLGLSIILVNKVFSNIKYSIIYTILLLIGLNWIWFNLFIGLVFKGLFFEMLLRGSIDIIFISLVMTIKMFFLKKCQKIMM